MNTFRLNKTDGFYYAPPIGSTEKLDYTLDLVNDLGNDSIAPGGVTWSATPTGIIIDSSAISGTDIIVRLRGATPGQGPWIISAVVLTVGGQQLAPYFKIAVRP